MHFRQHRADRRAMHRLRIELRFAVQLGDDGRRLAVEFMQDAPFLVGDRRRHQHVAVGKVAHQFEVERQLLERQFLENGQDVFACFGRQEEVGVFNTGRNALERKCLAEVELPNPLRKVIQGDRCENCHVTSRVREWLFLVGGLRGRRGGGSGLLRFAFLRLAAAEVELHYFPLRPAVGRAFLVARLGAAGRFVRLEVIGVLAFGDLDLFHLAAGSALFLDLALLARLADGDGRFLALFELFHLRRGRRIVLLCGGRKYRCAACNEARCNGPNLE